MALINIPYIINQILNAMKHLLLAPFLLGFISPVFADSWKDIDDLKNLIESNGTEIKELNNCEKII